MTLGLHETRQRRRRRARWAIAKWIMGLGAVLAAGVFAYETGSTLAQRDVEGLGREIEGLDAKVGELEDRNTRLRARLIVAGRQLKEAKERYDKDVPSGELATLLGRVRDKLDAGVGAGRLAFVIGAAQNARVCDEAPVTKRFLVQTELYKGANDSVGFANGAITVTAAGETATNEEGKVEAWFDPAMPIAVRFTEIGGKTTERTGKLPLHTSIVIGDSEYRYTVIAGARGFVQVTGDRCDYP